jgi:hypothetical protein
MNWTAVAINHWVTTTPAGPISLKKWPLGWVLIVKSNRHNPSTLFYSLRSAVTTVRHLKAS